MNTCSLSNNGPGESSVEAASLAQAQSILADQTDSDPIQPIPDHEKPSVYFEETPTGPTTILRASSIGDCHLKLALIAMGYEKVVSDAVRRAWAAGHIWERWIKFRLRDLGQVITHEQIKINFNILPIATVRGHWDGFMPEVIAMPAFGISQPIRSKTVAEAKSMHEDHFNTFKCRGVAAFPNYGMQGSLYLHWARMVWGDPTIGIAFIAQNKADLMDLHIQYLSEPPFTVAQIQSKVLQVLAMIHGLKSGQNPKCDQYKNEVFQCGFSEFHQEAETTIKTVDLLQPIDNLFPDLVQIQAQYPDLESLCARYKELARNMAADKLEQDQLRRLLQIQYDMAGADKVKAVTHTLRMQSGGSYVNHSAIKRDFPEFLEIYEDYKIPGRPSLRVDGPREKKSN